MPLDGNITDFSETETEAKPKPTLPNPSSPPSEKLFFLADFIETLPPKQVNMDVIDSPCGTAHCAWGWAIKLNLIPSGNFCFEIDTAIQGSSQQFGLTDKQFCYLFGGNSSFPENNYKPAPADIARHLREVAAELTSSQAPTPSQTSSQ